MLVKIKVGQIWTDGFDRYQITSIDGTHQPFANNLEINRINTFASPLVDGLYDMPRGWYVDIEEKVIPGIPLDTSLPILEAGHLQDRLRKRYNKQKEKQNVK